MRLQKHRPKRSLVVLASTLLILIVAGAIVLTILDSVLLTKARSEASAFGERIGRPITIGTVSTKVLSGFAVEVSRVEIGAAAGEQSPLLTLQRARVRPALLKAILSRGNHLEIRSAEIDGLAMNVVRFADGTTNLERLQSRLSETIETKSSGGKTTPQSKEERTPSSNIQLDHFALKEGTIRLVDQSRAKGNTAPDALQIKHLEIRVDDVRAGASLAVLVKAAVLDEKQNLELHLKSAPLPASLVPTPKQLALKVQPIDLKPIAPYLPKDIGLQEGRLSADLSADLGGAVPGGEGETRLQGVLNAPGLRFAGAEAGKSLDVSLDVAAQGDAAKGDARIDRLKLDVGPAEITGQGRVVGLTSSQPRVEGLEIVSRDLDLARIAALVPPLKRKLKGQIAGPIGLTVRGSGTETSAVIEAKVDLTPVRLAIPDTVVKAPGKPMTLVAQVRGAPAGALRFDLHADLSGADLRPGELLDKAPGQPMELALTGVKSGGKGSKNEHQKVELTEMTAHVRDSVVNGKGWVELSGSGKDTKKSFELSLHSPRLDLDQLLAPSKKEKPPPDPSLFAGIRGHATAKVDSLRKSKMDFNNLIADVKMVDDQVTLQTFSVGAFGGKISADGTTIRLAHRKAPFHLTAQLQNLDASRAMTFATDHNVLAGMFNGEVNLSGVGTDKSDLTNSLSGALQGHLMDGKFMGKDLISSVWEPVAKALPLGLASLKPDAGATNLGKDLAVGLTVEKGVAKLKAPIQVSTQEAQIKLGGGVHLDGNLDLEGTIALTPFTVSSLTHGKATPVEPIPIGVKIRGPAWKPTLAEVDVKDAVASIAKQTATGVLDRFLGGTGGSASLKQGATPSKDGQRPEDAVGKEADKAKKEAEDKAKNFLKGLGGH